MTRVVLWCWLCAVAACTESLYAVLGLGKNASPSEIKQAYRAMAKLTHPDKQTSKPQEEAAVEFRRVSSAYEVLSDPSARRIYDATGGTPSGSAQHQHQHHQHHHHHHQHFNQRGKRNVHRHLYDHFLRRLILSAQERLINIWSLAHLLNVASDDGVTLERYVLLAFTDGGDDCSHKLLSELLFPWPFAGHSEGGSHGEGSYWDDIIVVGRVDVKDAASVKLAKHFGVSGLENAPMCPAFVMLNRGDTLSPRHAPSPQRFASAEAFSTYVWPLLKVSVTFINDSPWELDFWWLDGTLGQKVAILQVGERYAASTFLSHTFIFRPTFVEGHSLTNASSLMWFTAKVHHDGSEINIVPRCLDKHGDCARWKSEGFCEHGKGSTPSWYVQQNPTFSPWVRENCVVSCGRRCQADSTKYGRNARGQHFEHRYHSHDEL